MESQAKENITHPGFPELAGAVREVIPTTVSCWEQAARMALPNAEAARLDQFRDDLPQILMHVAEVVSNAQRPGVDVPAQPSTKQSDVRYDQGYKLPEVFIEFAVLRGSLATQLAVHLNRPLQAVEILALGNAIDVSLRWSVIRFVEHLTGQLKAATEAQSKYLSFLSHDLRGGLNGVFLMIEVLKRELAGETRLAETLEDLDIMRRSLIETVATMDRFLHAERFRKGKVKVRLATLTVKKVLNEVAANFNYQAKDKGVEIRCEIPADLTIISDRDLLTMIFQNLLSNALKYTHSGTPVHIVGNGDPNFCTISVIDQGPGIEPEKLNELFAPFSRGETYGQPGVGLGLSIARQAAQYLNAKLWAESELGKGSSFIVQLPRTLTVAGQA